MALSTFISAKINETDLVLDEVTILTAYVIAFGDIPTITYDAQNGFRVRDVSHALALTINDYTMRTDMCLPPSACVDIYAGLVRLVGVLGGGKMSSTNEFQDVDTLPKTENIAAINNFTNVIEKGIDDIKKFLERPFDDKGFFKEKDWQTLHNDYVYFVSLIDKWFYANIPLPHSSKYLAYKYNMENFLLYCAKYRINYNQGDNPLTNVLDNLESYFLDYKSYLARYDEETSKAMRKSLNNIKNLTVA